MQKYWWYDSEWHSKMDKSMQVAGMGERTREAYLRSMRQLVEYYDAVTGSPIATQSSSSRL